MSNPNFDAARRLTRLQRVLTGRRARLESTIARQSKPATPAGPLRDLRRYGYPLALVLAATAVLPTVAAFAWRRRKLLTEVALNGLGIWKLRKRIDAARSSGSGR